MPLQLIEWLRPDWVYDPSTRKFARGCLQQRPKLDVVVAPIPYAAWEMFAPYHYLTADLHRAARCWGLWVNGTLAAFAGMLHRVMGKHSQRIHGDGLIGCSRLVTLPDFQGLGLAFVLVEAVASVYKGVGKAVHTYPAHPSLIRGFDQSPTWELRKRPGHFSPPPGITSTLPRAGSSTIGGRPCAVFRYQGPAIERARADALLAYWSKS